MTDLVQLLKELRSSLGKFEKALKAMGGVTIGGKAKRRKPKVSAAAQRARRTKTKAAKAGK
jgi:hypothetical protein